jgi:FERM/RhoGEF/pleckstrin domain protein 2
MTLQENLVKLMELQRDLVGYDNLVQAGREFVREGCLQKLSRKGYQQRMFFLVSFFYQCGKLLFFLSVSGSRSHQ